MRRALVGRVEVWLEPLIEEEVLWVEAGHTYTIAWLVGANRLTIQHPEAVTILAVEPLDQLPIWLLILLDLQTCDPLV